MGEIDPVLLTSLRNEVGIVVCCIGLHCNGCCGGFAVDFFHAMYIVAHCNCSCI